MSDWIQIILAALGASTLTAVVAPWVNWRLERKRAAMAERAARLAKVRAAATKVLRGELYLSHFLKGEAFMEFRPFMDDKILVHIGEVLQMLEDGPPDDPYYDYPGDIAHRVLAEAERIEEKWDLV